MVLGIPRVVTQDYFLIPVRIIDLVACKKIGWPSLSRFHSEDGMMKWKIFKRDPRYCWEINVKSIIY